MIEIKNVCFGYHKEKLNLDRISFRCQAGDCTAILGNNGCGKTTLVKVIDRILKCSSGEICLDGEDLLKKTPIEVAKKIAYVAQENRPGHTTVYDAIMLGRKPYIRFQATEHDYEVTESVIRMLHLEEYAQRYTDELSGGEYQKIILGRALAQEPHALLLDEPTSNLDMRNQKEVLSLVSDIVKQTDMIAIVVIHDVNAALRYCNQFVFLKDHKVHTAGDIRCVTEEVLEEVYGLPVGLEVVRGYPVVIPLDNGPRK